MRISRTPASASDFPALHRPGRPFVLPNAWDVASALLLADAGFPAIGTTSLGVTAAAGLPDGADAGREPTVALARRLAGRLPVPLTVDLEGGYAESPADVGALAADLADLGVAGVNLEDGRSDGTLRAVHEHAAVIGAVVEAAPGLFVNARTDTYWLRVGPEGSRPGETIRRLSAYREAGASGAFVPGLYEPDQVAAVAEAAGLPLNVLWHPGADLSALAGAGVARLSTGSALYRQALAAAVATAKAVRAGIEPPLDAPIDYHRLQDLLRPGPPPGAV